MRIENTFADQMALSLLCFSRNPVLWIPVFAPLILVFALLLGFGFGFFSILLTSTLLILYSTLLFTFSKQIITKPPLMDKPDVPEEAFRSNLVDQYSSLPVPAEDMMVSEPKPERDEPQKEDDRERGDHIHQYAMRSQDFSSESERLDQSSTTEDSEAEWPFRDNTDHSPDFSDGSISDEDSLIEIALPSGHYVGHDDHKKEEGNKLSLQQKFMGDKYMAQYPIWKQQYSLMGLLAEFNEMMNEEENLIEIDISMGSIKCPRFEIEA